MAAAQYDSLLHRPYPERVEALNNLYTHLVLLKDSAALVREVEAIGRFARRNSDKELEMEMDLFTAYYNAFFRQHGATESVAGLTDVISAAEAAHIRHIQIRGMRALAEYYWHNVKNYELAFEQYLLLSKELGAMKAEEYPDMAFDLLKIAEAYYFFQDYAQAKKYLERIIQLPETAFNTRFVNSAKNTLGLCYQKEGNLAQADYYFKEVLKTPFPHSGALWERIVLGNIGTNHYLRREYDKAEPLLKNDYTGAEADNDFGPAAGALIRLADIALEKDDLTSSWEYMMRARHDIRKSNQKDRLQHLFPVMSKWYSVRGNASLARIYLDSTVLAIKEFHENFSAIKVLRAQQKINLQEEEMRHAEFNLEKQRKAGERNILIVVVAGLCAFIVTGYYSHRRQQLTKDLQLQAAARELKEFTRRISEKNKLIAQLQSQHSEEEKNELIRELQRSTILTEDDWAAFQRLFEKVHSGFLNRLKEKIPALSPAEIRILTLTRLNLTTREMAGILGVGMDTIRQHRSRIRKKLGITDEPGLDSLLKDL